MIKPPWTPEQVAALEAITEDKASEILSEIAIDEWDRPIMDHLAARWALARIAKLEAAIRRHHDQIADDRCILDDDELYAAAGLQPADHRVGDKAAMLKNCKAFIEKRFTGGGWPTYAKLRAALERLARFGDHTNPTHAQVRKFAREALEA